MKKKFYILAAISFIATTSLATIRTVSNHVLNGSQYSTLQAAYDASSNGDSLLIEGTSTAYSHGSLSSWGKLLVVIGQGYNTQKQNFSPTIFSKFSTGAGSSASFILGTGGNSSKFYGINFTGSGSSNVLAIQASNCVFENCKFDRQVNISGSGNTFMNCIFNEVGNVNLTSVNNTLFSSCIFNYSVTGTAASPSVLFDHCLFLSNGVYFSSASNYTVKNSIFMNSITFTGISSSNFQNNICRLSATFPPAGNTDLGGNLSGADPLFTMYTFGTLYSNSHDYHLQATSPALAAASDGTEIGLHGGTSKFSEQGEPLNTPVMRSMNINNTTVSPNGTLNVNLSASKPDDN